MVSFSERIGIKKSRLKLQIHEIDESLRNSLWNLAFINLRGSFGADEHYGFYIRLYKDHLKRPVDEISKYPDERDRILKEFFYSCSWNEVYDLIEFMIRDNSKERWNDKFTETANSLLEKELSGYRFVGEKLTPITNPTELTAVEEVLIIAEENEMETVEKHIKLAIDKFADREKPDYRNSIKESISAVEAIVNIIVGSERSLNNALNLLDKKLKIPPSLKIAFGKIYGYTSSTGGIRHFLIEGDKEPESEDAKYMLVSCSAFICYLIVKAKKAELLPKNTEQNSTDKKQIKNEP